MINAAEMKLWWVSNLEEMLSNQKTNGDRFFFSLRILISANQKRKISNRHCFRRLLNIILSREQYMLLRWNLDWWMGCIKCLWSRKPSAMVFCFFFPKYSHLGNAPSHEHVTFTVSSDRPKSYWRSGHGQDRLEGCLNCSIAQGRKPFWGLFFVMTSWPNEHSIKFEFCVLTFSAE